MSKVEYQKQTAENRKRIESAKYVKSGITLLSLKFQGLDAQPLPAAALTTENYRARNKFSGK